MKLFFILISNLLCFSAFAQQEIRVFFEKKNNGYILYADNNAFCPVSMSLDLNLVNLRFSKSEKKIFVVPQKTEKFLLGELDVIYPVMPNNSHIIFGLFWVVFIISDTTRRMNMTCHF